MIFRKHLLLPLLLAKNTKNNLGFASRSSLTATTHCFQPQCATMELAHRATAKIMANTTERLKNVMSEEKMREELSTRPNRSYCVVKATPSPQL